MRKTKHHINPPNPYLDAYLDTWRAYTNAYHADAPNSILEPLYEAYDDARCRYEENPQWIFHSN